MPLLVRESHDLVLDRRAVARPGAVDLAGIERRAVQILADDAVRLGVGVDDVAGDLLDPVERLGIRAGGERRDPFLALLDVETGEIDRTAVDARRGPGLEAHHRDAERPETVVQTFRREGIVGTRMPGDVADVREPAEIGPGGDHDGAAGEFAHRGGRDARDAQAAVSVRLGEEPRDFALDEGEIRRLLDRVLHEGGIGAAVGLNALGADGGALRGVERAGLEGDAVGGVAHFPAHRVDLKDEVPLPGPADGGIAGHVRDGVEGEGEERGGEPGPRGSQRRLHARMPRADDDDVEVHSCMQTLYGRVNLN